MRGGCPCVHLTVLARRVHQCIQCMSAPESGSVSTMACSLSDDMWISTVEDGDSFVEAITGRVKTACVGVGGVDDGDCCP